MTDPEYLEIVSKMSAKDVLEEIRNNPYYFTDPHYSDIVKALQNRFDDIASSWQGF